VRVSKILIDFLDVQSIINVPLLPKFFRLGIRPIRIPRQLAVFSKERLLVYLTRFCEVRYCLARHVDLLVTSGVSLRSAKHVFSTDLSTGGEVSII